MQNFSIQILGGDAFYKSVTPRIKIRIISIFKDPKKEQYVCVPTHTNLISVWNVFLRHLGCFYCGFYWKKSKKLLFWGIIHVFYTFLCRNDKYFFINFSYDKLIIYTCFLTKINMANSFLTLLRWYETFFMCFWIFIKKVPKNNCLKTYIYGKYACLTWILTKWAMPIQFPTLSKWLKTYFMCFCIFV